MDNLFEQTIWQVAMAGALGAAIGAERGMAGKAASLRTFSLVSVASCLFTILSINSSVEYMGPDPSRVAAQIVSGIGFLGAGVIFRSPRGVTGLTTAALMWVTAAIGMAVGFGREDVAFAGTFVSIAILLIFKLVYLFMDKIELRDKKRLSSSSSDDDAR